MPRIPTFTATLTTPPSRTSEELSISSAEQPGAALAGLGRELQRSGAVFADIADQRSREKELRWAADANQRFTEDSIRWQQENGNKEDSGEQFKAWSDSRIGELEKEAPNGRSALAFKLHVLPQANKDWEFNLKKGEATRLSNYKVGEAAASQAAQDAYRFRFNQGNPDAEPLRAQDLKAQISRNNAAYGTVAPAHAQDMNEQAVVSAVLGAAEHNPAFAKQLLNEFTLVDIPKRETLLAHIEAKEDSMASVDKQSTLRLWDSQQQAAWNTLTPITAPKNYEIFGKQAGVVKSQQEQKDKNINAAIMAYSAVSDKNAAAQYSALDAYRVTDPSDPDAANKQDVFSLLSNRINESAQLQQADPHLWLTRENPLVSEAQTEWASTVSELSKSDDPNEQYALQARARGYRSVMLDLSAHFQGHPPEGTDGSYYLRRNSNAIQVLTKTEAQSYADSIMQGGPETADRSFMEFAASFPPQHLGAAWQNLSTLPPEGHRLPADWQIASTIADPLVRKRVLGAAKNAKDLAALVPERKQKLEDAFKNDVWQSFGEVMGGDTYQRSPWINSYKEVIKADAIGLMNGPMKMSEKQAVMQSTRDIIGAQWGFQTMYNGQGILIPRQRSDWTEGGQQKPQRTEEELAQIPNALAMSLRVRLPPELIPTKSLEWLPDADKKKRGDPEVEQWVQKSVMQSARWKMEQDGQSYSLFVYDQRHNNDFQLIDKKGRPFVVPIDAAMAQATADVATRIAVPQSLYMGIEGGFIAPIETETSPKKPSDIPPVYEELKSFEMFDPKYWSFEKPLMLPLSKLFTRNIAYKADKMPNLGPEWINQQPGATANPALENTRIITEKPPKPQPKPKR